MTHTSSASYQFGSTTHPSPAYQPSPTTHPSPSYQSAPNLATTQCQLLIEVLQDMACDPSWKTDTGFRSNYMCEVHRRILVTRPSFSKKVSPHIESKVKWLKTNFHAINDMLKQSGCSWNDIDKKIACERDCSPSMQKEDVLKKFMSEATQTASNLNNSTKMANKQKTSTIGGKAAKKRKTRDMETQLEGINHSFQTFVEGFNANFGTMANAVANAMTDDNMSKKAASEKLKDVLDELMKLDIPSGDVLHAGEIFAANKDKMDLFMNFSKPL
ncbi:hypothetical protein Tco_1399770 [Tanacetum coccineum]